MFNPSASARHDSPPLAGFRARFIATICAVCHAGFAIPSPHRPTSPDTYRTGVVKRSASLSVRAHSVPFPLRSPIRILTPLGPFRALHPSAERPRLGTFRRALSPACRPLPQRSPVRARSAAQLARWHPPGTPRDAVPRLAPTCSARPSQRACCTSHTVRRTALESARLRHYRSEALLSFSSLTP